MLGRAKGIMASRMTSPPLVPGTRSGKATFGIFLGAQLLLSLVYLGLRAMAYVPPAEGQCPFYCPTDGLEWFIDAAVLAGLPGVLVGASISSLAHRAMYGSFGLPHRRWIGRVAVIAIAVFSLLLAFLALAD
jgi:hypothetical protein